MSRRRRSGYANLLEEPVPLVVDLVAPDFTLLVSGQIKRPVDEFSEADGRRRRSAAVPLRGKMPVERAPKPPR